jgi:RsiW-degrading membrane proteinase PrsW (M82 family)
MKEDDDDMPEPKVLIIKTFILGGLVGFVALVIQALIIKIEIAKFGEASGVILFAFVEEFLKFFIIYKAALSTRFNNERMDPVLYMIIGALGFAAVENIFYLIDYINNLEYVKSMIDGSYRFIGSTLVHTISSAFIGISCAFVFFKRRAVKILAIIFGLSVATFMHSLFNFLVSSQDEFLKNIAFYGS